jgi:hypothetical protein
MGRSLIAGATDVAGDDVVGARGLEAEITSEPCAWQFIVA